MSSSTSRKALRILRADFPGDPVLDTAVSHALLRAVAAGRIDESLRLYRPDDVVVFSLLDARRPGFARAREVAEGHGFGAVIRLGGGHAAVFQRESLAFAWSSAAADAPRGIPERFERVAAWLAAGLGALGVDARVGQVEGEYCPGDHSVNAGGRVKLAGVGQRVIRGGAHVGGVVVTGESARARAVLVEIYQALELDWAPETCGAVEDEIGPIAVEAVAGALMGALPDSHVAIECALEPELVESARGLLDFHRPEGGRRVRSRTPGKALIVGDS